MKTRASKKTSRKLYVLKIGGSVATIKGSSRLTVRRALLARIFKTLKTALAKDPTLALIIIHGAGTFGHTLAHEYRLREGTHAHREGKKGAALTRRTLQTLNTEILTLALKAGLLATTIHTGTFFIQKGKKLTYDAGVLTHALFERYVPILYGDMIFDTTRGMRILGGDEIAALLTRTLPVTKLFFASDVDGIFTTDPHRSATARLIPELALNSKLEKKIAVTGSHNRDVTGGLKGKIDSCRKLFEKSVLTELHIFNGLHPENFANIFSGKQFPHTILTK